MRVFVNNDSIASLASLSSRLDYLISIDTGNVHLCNVLQVPNFVFVDRVARYRFGGGGDTFAPKFGWQKEYAKTLKIFTQKVKERLEIVAQTP